MLSTVVEPTTRVASCNLSAAGNASCSEQPLLAKELAGGKSQAASARPLEVLTADSPPYPHRCDAGPQNWPPTPIPLHRSPSLCDVSIVHPVCSILFWFFSLSLWRLTLGLSRAQEPQRRRSEGCCASAAGRCSALHWYPVLKKRFLAPLLTSRPDVHSAAACGAYPSMGERMHPGWGHAHDTADGGVHVVGYGTVHSPCPTGAQAG
jgi:hypothetical protein